VLAAAASAGAREAAYIFLRLPHEVKAIFDEWLQVHFPDRAARVLGLVREASGGRDYDNRFGIRQTGRGPYADMLGKRFRAACKRYGLDPGRRESALDCSRFEPPGQRQLGLF
jgi:DNA repair photolyase